MTAGSRSAGSSRHTTCQTCGVRVKEENLASHYSRVHPRIRPEVPAASKIPPVPRVPRPRRSGTRPLVRAAVFLLAIALTAAAIGFLAYRSAQRGQPREPNAVPVTVSMGGFTPSALSARSGESLRVNLINLDNSFHSDGGGNHNFVLPALGISILVPPEEQRAFTVPAGSAGAYEWYCDVCCGGKDNPLMVGTLTVTE